MGKAAHYNLDIAAHDFRMILDSARNAFQAQDADLKNVKIKEVADRAKVSHDIIQIQRHKRESVQKSKKGNSEVIQGNSEVEEG